MSHIRQIARMVSEDASVIPSAFRDGPDTIAEGAGDHQVTISAGSLQYLGDGVHDLLKGLYNLLGKIEATEGPTVNKEALVGAMTPLMKQIVQFYGDVSNYVKKKT